jgi:2-polyprenyl-3-methyl-5-hydroxy-6-metoxy-1,4-benzoquinol methylase
VSDRARELAAHYNERYYAERVGDEPYHHGNPIWRAFFGGIAAAIVAELEPRTALDAGCGIGFLVQALRERGVDAVGFDVSEYAISQVPDEVRPYCSVRSITDELDGDYDVIICIEVLEHLPADEADAAVANLARHTDVVVFSSTPEDFREATHLNVRPPEYWVGLFARHGLFRDAELDADFVAPHALVLRRAGQTAPTIAR